MYVIVDGELVADGEITKMEFVSVFEGTSFATHENSTTAEMLMDSIEPLALHPATVAHMFVNTVVCEIELYKHREQPSCVQPMFSHLSIRHSSKIVDNHSIPMQF